MLFKKTLIRLSVSAIFLLAFSLRFVDVIIGEKLYEYPLETAWKATGLPLNQVLTETWMKLNDQYLSINELKTVASQIKDKLKVEEKAKMTCGQQEEFNYVCFEGIRNDGTEITITLQSANLENQNETQLGINTFHDGFIKNLKSYIENIKESIVKLGSNVHFSVALEGKRQGKITPLLIKELSGKAFQKISAVPVESTYENGYSSDKGYTRLIEDVFVYNFKKTNIEFITRYDESDNLTHIIIATPNLTDGV